MVAVFATGARPVSSADTVVVSSSVTSEYPEGIRIKLEVRSDIEIAEIEFRARVGQRAIGQVDELCKDTGAAAEDWRCEDLEPGTSVKAELFWRTAYTASYIPPGVIIVYSFAIKDAEGGVLETEPEEFIYLPTAFEWEEITKGPVTVAFHGPVQSRAETILDTILETIEKMEPAMGIEIVDPIRVTVFNNQVEMIEAQQRRSGATTRQTATLGQASTEEGVLIMIADRNSIGTASHEVMHILVHRAGDSPFRNVPSWLDEGLAEYGNIDVGYEYDIALEFAVETGILLPFMYMATPPSEPEQLIIFYGQGKSIARLMIQRWGEAKMAELLAHHKVNGNIERAIQDVYGDYADRAGEPVAGLDRRRAVRPGRGSSQAHAGSAAHPGPVQPDPAGRRGGDRIVVRHSYAGARRGDCGDRAHTPACRGGQRGRWAVGLQLRRAAARRLRGAGPCRPRVAPRPGLLRDEKTQGLTKPRDTVSSWTHHSAVQASPPAWVSCT